MKTNAIFPILLASATLFSCGRKMNKVEKEVIVYHDGACNIDTSAMAGHDLIEADAAIAAQHNGHHKTYTPRANRRSESYYSSGTTVSKPQGTSATTYKRPASPVDAEVGMDEFDRKHTTVQRSGEQSKPGVTGTGATQAAGTGTSSGRPVN